MTEKGVYKVKVGEKEIEIDTHVLEVLQRYVHTEMSLEELAARLGLESWEEAYEFVKNIPAWILWIPSTLWKTMRGMEAVSKEVSRPSRK
ncbi:MAG: hypothetical protein GSR86_01795 [Desulfurococcales archaeon]|nr:hypothetical protein [Desulfurococcales archaeon]